ncbi:MAG TPA: hypothetical protein VF607_07770, partial [Verrucomicrobiae bacterium]
KVDILSDRERLSSAACQTPLPGRRDGRQMDGPKIGNMGGKTAGKIPAIPIKHRRLQPPEILISQHLRFDRIPLVE